MHELNLLQKAINQVPKFRKFYNLFNQAVTLSGLSQSTHDSYARHLAKMALHFNMVPTKVGSGALKQYLFDLHGQSGSDTQVKHAIYSIKFAYKIKGIESPLLAFPGARRPRKLPVVLNRDEVKALLEAPTLLKHKVLLGLLYGCGLRCMEARGIKLADLDFGRKSLFVRYGKGGRQRYVPLGKVMVGLLAEYIRDEQPRKWLFNGKPRGRAGGDFDNRYSNRGVHWVVRQSAITAGIIKTVSAHTLRHTFATHLLEDGLDIVSIKELLGHARIETTMVYLHVAQFEHKKPFSPLDTLYPLTAEVSHPS